MHSKYFCLMVRLENVIPWRSLFATIYAYTIYLLVFIIRQTNLTVRLKSMISIKQKFPIIVNVIYTARKIKWEMMWSSRNTKVLDSFSPQKWKVNTTCSMFHLFKVQVHWHSVLLAQQPQMTCPPYKIKNLWITHNRIFPKNSASELPHAHLFLPETDYVI